MWNYTAFSTTVLTLLLFFFCVITSPSICFFAHLKNASVQAIGLYVQLEWLFLVFLWKIHIQASCEVHTQGLQAVHTSGDILKFLYMV